MPAKEVGLKLVSKRFTRQVLYSAGCPSAIIEECVEVPVALFKHFVEGMLDGGGVGVVELEGVETLVNKVFTSSVFRR